MPRRLTLNQFADVLAPGELVYVPGSAGEPTPLLDLWLEDPERTRGVQLLTSFVPGINALAMNRLHGSAVVTGLFMQPSLQAAQNAIGHAQHLMVVFPLWLGDMPALFKGFLEQVMRPGFAVPKAESFKSKPLAGRTARIVVTMGMPAFLYRLYYRAHSLRLLRRNVFGLVGIKTVGDAVVGSVETLTESQRARWLARMHRWGRRLG